MAAGRLYDSLTLLKCLTILQSQIDLGATCHVLFEWPLYFFGFELSFRVTLHLCFDAKQDSNFFRMASLLFIVVFQKTDRMHFIEKRGKALLL